MRPIQRTWTLHRILPYHHSVQANARNVTRHRSLREPPNALASCPGHLARGKTFELLRVKIQAQGPETAPFSYLIQTDFFSGQVHK